MLFVGTVLFADVYNKTIYYRNVFVAMCFQEHSYFFVRFPYLNKDRRDVRFEFANIFINE